MDASQKNQKEFKFLGQIPKKEGLKNLILTGSYQPKKPV